jgi:hypothetical protein
MRQIEITAGTRKIIATSNGAGRPFTSTLYVNGGETATLIRAKHKSEAGMRKWADKVITA